MSVQPALSVIEILRIKDPNTLIVLENVLVTYITEKYFQAFSLQIPPGTHLSCLALLEPVMALSRTCALPGKEMRQLVCQCQSSAFFQKLSFTRSWGTYTDCCSDHSTTKEISHNTHFPSWILGIQHPPQQHNCNAEVV